MTILFQACVGPSAGKCHVRRQQPADDDNLVLCQATAYARDVTGKVLHSVICYKCVYKMAEMLKDEKSAGGVIPKCDTPDGLAQAIGLEKII